MKAVSLFSGGLDSQLAVCLIKNQGLTVIGVNFVTPFFGVKQSTVEAAQALDIELVTVDISNDYMDKVLKNPVYGYGQHMNPCIDCHAFMLKYARTIMEEKGASFLLTGEVLGQRPMSQNRSALETVEKLSGQKGLVVRPLSALLLELTVPEIEGWIKRSELLDISGRSRKRQMELAESLGIKEYPSPAGGCLLTEGKYANRLKYLLKMRPVVSPQELNILSWGRHFNIGGNLLVIGRNHKENIYLQEAARPGDLLIEAKEFPGPIALLRSADDQETDLMYIASIVARYGDGKNCEQVLMRIYPDDGSMEHLITVNPLHPDKTPAML